MDDKLFNCILSDKHHVPYQLLPPQRHCGYTLRARKHELCLINKSRLDEQNFMYVQTTLLRYVLNCNVMNRILFSIFIYLRRHLFVLRPMYSCVLTVFLLLDEYIVCIVESTCCCHGNRYQPALRPTRVCAFRVVEFSGRMLQDTETTTSTSESQCRGSGLCVWRGYLSG